VDRHKITSTLVHKRLKIGPPILPTFRKFCILLYCQASQTGFSKRNSTKLCQTVHVLQIALTICRRKVGFVFPQKLGANNFTSFWGFDEYHRARALENSPTLSQNFVYCGPQTALTWAGVLLTLSPLLRPQSIAHAISDINVAPHGESK